MSAEERRLGIKVHWWTRGRSDGLVATASLLSWTTEQCDEVGVALGLDEDDLLHARRRAVAYSEDQS